MKNLLYIGNNLQVKGANVSSVQILGSLLESEGYHVFYASSKRNVFIRFADMLWSCFRYRRRIDIVLIDTYSTLNFYYAWGVSQFCRLLKLPYVPILHGGNLEIRLVNSPMLSKMLFKSAVEIISPSLFLQEVFKKYGYENVRNMPNAIVLEKYFFQERTLKSSIKLLWVRAFSKIYNPLLAIRVLKRLQLEGYNASLCMVGPDSDGTMAHTKALAEELEVEVQFTDKLSKQEWHELSKHYNIFINTTNFDNMPVSVVEAMALGLPVVSTNVGGIPYLIEDGKDGLLVPPNDVEAFVIAIKRLFKQPVLAKTLAFNARKKAEQFDWSLVRLKWHDILAD